MASSEIDFPIPLPSGAIAWLRVPWPLGADDLRRLERGLRAGLRFARLAGWVTLPIPASVSTASEESKE